MDPYSFSKDEDDYEVRVTKLKAKFPARTMSFYGRFFRRTTIIQRLTEPCFHFAGDLCIRVVNEQARMQIFSRWKYCIYEHLLPLEFNILLIFSLIVSKSRRGNWKKKSWKRHFANRCWRQATKQEERKKLSNILSIVKESRFL